LAGFLAGISCRASVALARPQSAHCSFQTDTLRREIADDCVRKATIVEPMLCDVDLSTAIRLAIVHCSLGQLEPCRFRMTICHARGYPGQTHRAGLALAEWLCRTIDRVDPARVRGPFHRFGRSTTDLLHRSVSPCRLLRQLSPGARLIACDNWHDDQVVIDGANSWNLLSQDVGCFFLNCGIDYPPELDRPIVNNDIEL
jgi:hypothetical protein